MQSLTRNSRRRAHLSSLAFIIAASGAVTSVAVHAQQQFAFFLSAADRSGAPITDLNINEIAVAEGGRAARVIKVDPIAVPVKVTVMVDNGIGSAQHLLQYRNGLKGFFEALPIGLEASLLTLAPQPRWIVRRTNDRVQLLNGVDRISPDNSAARFVDALIEESERIEEENDDTMSYFPVLVVMATTGPEGSSPRERDVERMLRRFMQYAGRAHVVMLGTNMTSPSALVGARQVQVGKLLTEITGGRYEAIAAATRIASLLPEYGTTVAQAHAFQSQQYLVTVERPDGAKGPLGELSMGVTRPGLTFAATAQGLMP